MKTNSRKKSEKLEDRLIDFALLIHRLVEQLPDTYLGRNLSDQMTRSSTSPALNYGEAQSAHSNKDYVYKVGICLRELRETNVGIKIIDKGQLIDNQDLINEALTECNELIAIFVSNSNKAKSKV